jgi:hypothetical protein
LDRLPLGFKCLLIGNEMIIKKTWELLEGNEHRDELEEKTPIRNITIPRVIILA